MEVYNSTVPHKSLLQLEQRVLRCPRRHHQPRQEFDSLSAILSYCLRCLLMSPAMQSNAVMTKQICTSRKSPISFSSLVGWLVSWLPHIRADLVASYRSGQTKNCLETPDQEKWLLNQKICSSVQPAHPSSDRLCVAHLEVRCSHPYREDTGASIQTFSHCYQHT